MAVQEYFLRFGSGNPATVSGLAPTFILFRNYLGSNITAPGITEVGSTSGIYGFTFNATQSIVFTADGNTSSLSSDTRYVVGALGAIDSVNNNVLGISSMVADLGSTSIGIGNTLSFVAGVGLTNYQNILNLGSTAIGIGNTLSFGVGVGLTNYQNIVNQGVTVVAIGNTLLSLGLSNTVYASLGGLYALIGSTSSSYGDSSTDPTTVFGYLKRSIELFEGQQEFLKTTGSLTFYDRYASYTLRGFTISDDSSSTNRT